MTDDAFESQLLRFEQAWRCNGPCEIADFLHGPCALSSPARRRLLVELICIDLELRWRHWRRDPTTHERVTLESYVRKFPELVSLDQLSLELIGEEYRARRQWGDRPSHTEFLSRFLAGREQISAALLRIDRQVEEELAEPCPVARPAMRTLTSGEQPPVDPDFPLLSHHGVLLRRLIGAGKMGKVYQAWQRSTGREVAVKFLRRSFLDQPRVIQRFIGEARTIARLRHPNIVGTQGLGRTTGGAYFIVMDLVSGSNLDQVGRTRSVSIDEAVCWAIETCQALEHAHERGIIHCDLKPANLLLDGCGGIRVTDFGLARSLTEHMPWTAEVEGTAPFMAPEQASRCWGEIDERTDVYGIGSVLYTLLTGRAPWVGRRLADILAAVVSAAPVVAPVTLRPELSQPINDVCLRCLSKAPEHRYPTVRDLRSVLAGLLVRS